MAVISRSGLSAARDKCVCHIWRLVAPEKPTCPFSCHKKLGSDVKQRLVQNFTVQKWPMSQSELLRPVGGGSVDSIRSTRNFDLHQSEKGVRSRRKRPRLSSRGSLIYTWMKVVLQTTDSGAAWMQVMKQTSHDPLVLLEGAHCPVHLWETTRVQKQESVRSLEIIKPDGLGVLGSALDSNK